MPEIFKASPKGTVSEDIGKILESCPRSQWGSLMAEPNWLKFESQQDDERVVILGRRHLITNIGWIAIVSFASVVPMFLGEFPFFKVLNGNTMVSVTILWYLALIFFAMQNFLLWFYNLYIVTNERVVDVDFMGLLSKTVNVAPLSRIEDVNYSQRGLIASIFNLGDVIIQTASKQNTPDVSDEQSAFTFESIAYPDKVSAVISKLMEDEEDENKSH